MASNSAQLTEGQRKTLIDNYLREHNKAREEVYDFLVPNPSYRMAMILSRELFDIGEIPINALPIELKLKGALGNGVIYYAFVSIYGRIFCFNGRLVDHEGILVQRCNDQGNYIPHNCPHNKYLNTICHPCLLSANIPQLPYKCIEILRDKLSSRCHTIEECQTLIDYSRLLAVNTDIFIDYTHEAENIEAKEKELNAREEQVRIREAQHVRLEILQKCSVITQDALDKIIQLLFSSGILGDKASAP